MVKTELNIKNVCKNWGIGLIIAGIIPFIFQGIFDTTIGIIALLLGIITLVFRKRWNMALIGAFIILIGALNIIIILKTQEQYLFLIAGIIQILIGIGALNEYHKAVEGRSKGEYKQNNSFNSWWKKQKTYEKILIIILFIIIAFGILGYLFGY